MTSFADQPEGAVNARICFLQAELQPALGEKSEKRFAQARDIAELVQFLGRELAALGALMQHIAHHVFILGLVRGVELPALGLHLRQQRELGDDGKIAAVAASSVIDCRNASFSSGRRIRSYLLATRKIFCA